MAGKPSLTELRERLEVFKAAYDRCVQIDDWQSVVICQQRNRALIERTQDEIKRREKAGEM